MGTDSHPFDIYVADRASDLRLAEANLLFALDQYPSLCVSSHLKQLDGLADRVGQSNARSPADRVAALREVLVGEEQYLGDADNYYDPCNSYLNQVLTRRRGLPITLSAIWLDVANTLGWSFVGIGMPGHFLIGCPSEEGHILLDPFSGGCPVEVDACRDLLCKVYGRPVELTADHVAPVDTRKILGRMLNNLRCCYIAGERWHCAATIIRRMLALCPGNQDLTKELAEVEGLHAQQN